MGASAKLDQAAIVDAAFEVLNEAGLDGLSLRLVADQLGGQHRQLRCGLRQRRAGRNIRHGFGARDLLHADQLSDRGGLIHL